MPNEYTDLSPAAKTATTSLVVEYHPASVWLRMNRPESANALSPDLIAAIDLALTQALSVPGVRVVVITGSGTVFSSGADLAVAEPLLEKNQTQRLATYMEAANDLMDRIEDYPLPVVAAVNGAAFAGGLELVLACDLAVAAGDAPIGDAHARHGFVPAWGASHRLVAALGPAGARRLMLTGATFTAADVPGMFASVVPSDRLEEQVRSLINELSLAGPAAIREIKNLLASDPSTRARQRRREREALRRQLGTSDLAEGMAAFKAGRRPVFIQPDRATQAGQP